jgi:hypothetical protein
LLRRVLEVAFGLESNQSDYLFIPYSLRSDNSAVYAQLLGKHTNICKNNRNISLAGITEKMMMKALTKEDDSFREMLQEQPGAYIVDRTQRILDLGKWNISTDSEHYQALWVYPLLANDGYG